MANLYDIIEQNYDTYSDATHYTVSEADPPSSPPVNSKTHPISVYDDYGKENLRPIARIRRALFVKVLDYHLGENQDWAKIQIIANPDSNITVDPISLNGTLLNNTECYIKIFDILPIEDNEETLFNTANLAHLIEKPDLNFVVPDWRKRDETSPFYNRKIQEYWITITTDIYGMPNESQREEAKRRGIIGLFGYFAKEYNNSLIARYMSNAGFVQIKEVYVPSRPGSRTKCLVSIHAKYFNAIPQIALDASMLQSFLKDSRTVLLNTSKLANQINYIMRRFESFHQSVKRFKGGIKNVDFKKERKNLRNFFLGLKKLISENGFDFIETEEFMIEMGFGQQGSNNTSLNSGHTHSYEIDADGNGWTMEAYHPQNSEIKHRHAIMNYVVQEAASECYPNCYVDHGYQGSPPHMHTLLGLNDNNDDTCNSVLYVLYSSPYSQQMLVGFNKFKNKSFSKRGNTLNIIASIYDVVTDLKNNIDWFKFASKYFIKPPIINPTKKLSKASKKKRQRRDAVESYNSKNMQLNEIPFFDIEELDKINRYIADPNVRASFLAENLMSETFVGDGIFNLLSTIIENVGTLGDIYQEILFKVGLKDIIATTLAFASREMKQADTQEVVVRGYIQSLPYSKMNNIAFNREMPKLAQFKMFFDLFKNLRMTVEEYLSLLREIGIDQRYMFSWTVADYGGPAQDFNADSVIDSDDVAYIPGDAQGIMTQIGNVLFEHYVDYLGNPQPNINTDLDSFGKCKVKIEDFLSYEGMVFSLAYLLVYGTDINKDDLDSYNFDDAMNAEEWVNTEEDQYPIITDDYITLEYVDADEIKNRMVKALPKIFNKQDITESFNKSIKEIMRKPFVEMDILDENTKVFDLFGTSALFASLPPPDLDFMKIAVNNMEIEKDLSAFYGFVKESDTKYSNIKGQWEIPDIALGKLKFDFNFNNVLLNPTFDLSMFKINFNDDIMGDVMSMIIVAIKEAIKAAMLSIIQSLISSLTEAINGAATPVTNAMYGQECLQDLFEASSGTSSWESMVEDIFSEARAKAESNCKFCPPILPGEALSFFQKACDSLTPNELVDLVRGSSRGGLKPATATVLMDIAGQFPNIKCILDNDILEEMFEDVGEMIDSDLLNIVDQMYKIEPAGEALASCLVSVGGGTNYGESTIQSPYADIDAPCVDSEDECNTLPKQFKSVREFMKCRGLSESDIMSQINDAVDKKKDDLVDMIAAANKAGSDLINMEDMCKFLPKPSQIPALKFTSDIAFESIMGSIKIAYAADIATFPDIMIHKDPAKYVIEENWDYIPLRVEEGDFSYYAVSEEGSYTVIPVNHNTRSVNPVFARDYISGETIFDKVDLGFGAFEWQPTPYVEQYVAGQLRQLNPHEIISKTIKHNEFINNKEDRVPLTVDFHIKRKKEVGRVAPVMRNDLKTFTDKIVASWHFDPNGNGTEYHIDIDKMIKTAMTENEDYLEVPVDLTSQSPHCEDILKLELVPFCAIETEFAIEGAAADENFNFPNNMESRNYDAKLYKYYFTYTNEANYDSNNSNIEYGVNPFKEIEDMSSHNLRDDMLKALTLPWINNGSIVNLDDEALATWPGNFHNMMKSVLDLFANAVSDSKLFDIIKMQLIRLEPRDTDINKVNVDKKGKSLLDIEGAITRAKEHFENNCSFKDMLPDGRTQLQQSALVAVVELTIRIYLIDMLLRGVFLLEKVIKEDISDALFAILYQNFQQDMREFSPEFFDQFLDEMAYIYNERRLTDRNLPQVSDKKQMLKFLMKEQLTFMNSALQTVFKDAYKSVKRAFLESLPVVDKGDFLSMVLKTNYSEHIAIPPEISFSISEAEEAQLASYFSGVDKLIEQPKEEVEKINPSFYIKRYLIDTHGHKKNWNEEEWNNDSNFELESTDPNGPDPKRIKESGFDICFFDKDISKYTYEDENGTSQDISGVASYIASQMTYNTDGATIANWTTEFAAQGVKCVHYESDYGDDNWHFSLWETDDVPDVKTPWEWFFGADYSPDRLYKIWNITEADVASQGKAFRESELYRLHKNFWADACKGHDHGDDWSDWFNNMVTINKWHGVGSWEDDADAEHMWGGDTDSIDYNNLYVTDAIVKARMFRSDFIQPFGRLVNVNTLGAPEDGGHDIEWTTAWSTSGDFRPVHYYPSFLLYEWDEESGQHIKHEDSSGNTEFQIDTYVSKADVDTHSPPWKDDGLSWRGYGMDYTQGLIELITSDYVQRRYAEYHSNHINDLVAWVGQPADPIFSEQSPVLNNKGNFVSIPVAKSSVTIKQPQDSDLIDYSVYWHGLINDVFDDMINTEDSDFNKFFNNILPIEKIYDVFFSYCIALTSRHVPGVEEIFQTSKIELKRTFQTLIKRFDNFEYRDGDVMEKGGTPAMYKHANTVSSTSPDFASIAAKFAALAPFMIIKGLAENFDPNIKIAKYIRLAAMQAGVDVTPIMASLAALPMNVIPPPPIGPGIGPPIGPLGIMYLASGFLEPKEREKLGDIRDGVNSSAPPGNDEGVVLADESNYTFNEDGTVVEAEYGAVLQDELPSEGIIEGVEALMSDDHQWLSLFATTMQEVWKIMINYTHRGDSADDSDWYTALLYYRDEGQGPFYKFHSGITPDEKLNENARSLFGFQPVFQWANADPAPIHIYWESDNINHSMPSHMYRRWAATAPPTGEARKWKQEGNSDRQINQNRTVACWYTWTTYMSLWEFYWRLLFLLPTGRITVDQFDDEYDSAATFCFMNHESEVYKQNSPYNPFISGHIIYHQYEQYLGSNWPTSIAQLGEEHIKYQLFESTFCYDQAIMHVVKSVQDLRKQGGYAPPKMSNGKYWERKYIVTTSDSDFPGILDVVRYLFEKQRAFVDLEMEYVDEDQNEAIIAYRDVFPWPKL